MVQEITAGNGIERLLPSTSQANGQKRAETTTGGAEDTVEIGQQTAQTATTYSRSLIIGMTGSDGVTDFETLVSRLLERQGITWQAAMSGETVEVDEETRAEARALISEEGYWGVEKTSERIFQMAVAGAGGDTEKLEQIKAAIDKGFEMAEEAWGGTLPEISQKTYDAVMEKLDGWASNGEADG